VLTAIGLDAATIASTIRLSFGRSTTLDDVTEAVAALAAID
jgi:cysteine sulfinate desulfinase/cysteine desulfurase-like protein